MTATPLHEAVSDCNALIFVLEDLSKEFRRKTRHSDFTRDDDIDFLKNAGRRALAGNRAKGDPGRIDAIKNHIFSQPLLRQKFEEHRERSTDEKLDAFLNQQTDPTHTAAGWTRDRQKMFIADMTADKRLRPIHYALLYVLFQNAWPDTDRVKQPLAWFSWLTGYTRKPITFALHQLAKWKYIKRQRSNGGQREYSAYLEIVRRAYERHEKRVNDMGSVTVSPEHSNDHNCVAGTQLDPVTVSEEHTYSIKGSRAEPKAGARYARGPQEAASLRSRREEEGSSVLSRRVRDRVRLNDPALIDEHAPTAQPRPRKTGPRRQFGDPARWEPFFDRFYTDLSYGYSDQKKGLDEPEPPLI